VVHLKKKVSFKICDESLMRVSTIAKAIQKSQGLKQNAFFLHLIKESSNYLEDKWSMKCSLNRNIISLKISASPILIAAGKN